MTTLAPIGKNIAKVASKHAPEILGTLAIGSFIGATITACKFHPRGKEALKNVKNEKMWTKIKTVGPYYIVPVVLTINGAVCIVSALWLQNKTIALLSASCTAGAEAIKAYRGEIRELVDGDDTKAKAIDKKVSEIVKEHGNEATSRDIYTPNTTGLYLCVDGISGQTFFSNEDKLKGLYQWIQLRLATDTYCTVNDYLAELDLNPTSTGDGRGWAYTYAGEYESRSTIRPIMESIICETPPYTGFPAIRVSPSWDPRDFD